MRKRNLLAVVLLLALSACGAPSATFTGKCVAVTDGDTIRVMRSGREVRVRLDGIDAPERNQDFGTQAKKFASSLVFGRQVRVEDKGEDRYGRTLGIVFVGKINVNEELVKNGYAWWYRHYAPNNRRLELLERQARDAGKGLWSQPNPIPPWEFRREERRYRGR